MPADFSDLLIPTFPNINDQPVSPTATRAGNGAHLIKNYNELVNKLNDNLSKWKIINDSYTASAGDRLVLFNDGQALNIVSFPTNPTEGDSISLILASGIVYLANIVILNNVGILEIALTSVFEPIDLIYISDSFGWLASKANVLQVTDVNNPPPA